MDKDRKCCYFIKLGKPGSLAVVEIVQSADPTQEEVLLVSLEPTITFMVPIRIHVLDECFEIESFVDSGATTCFIDRKLVQKFNIPLIKKSSPTVAEFIDGRPLASGDIIEETQALKVTLEDQVSRIAFNVIDSPTSQVVIGLP